MVKITIVGTGYVGLVTGTCLAEVGHEVICADIDENKIIMLNKGEIPIYEPGLKELVNKNVEKGRLQFTTYIDKAIQESDVIFSAVGTPPDEDHKADLQYVKAVATIFAKNLNKYKVFVNKSTVPVGTGDMVKRTISSITNTEFDVVSNPEFLREGAAVKDFLNPDRIVLGCESEHAKEVMGAVYRPFVRTQSPILFTDIKSAELIKYAANSMLATRISFINEIANFCDIVGADIKAVAKGIGLDNRIGPKFLQAGIGYGGSCFPKDVNALIESGKENNHEFKILNSVEEVNRNQKLIVVDKLKERLGSLKGKNIAIWGIAFKPKTDDIREAPAIYIIEKLLSEGANVKASDYVARDNFQKEHAHFEIEMHDDHYEILDDADALLLLTEWDEFRILNHEKLHDKMRTKLIIDGRNIYNPKEIIEKGFEYIGIGRK
ncbi:MAG: UDP-glucose/GDP-mannose dehydrogenase family protein [Candidatus Woesearchaeota archaeon]|jgi:UDPglucose 6-dehydrogenase|nr:UDP-glucose/GDP-mannose dehydrogenase family protein [Candidatus Woesearchaeota archaeon]